MLLEGVKLNFKKKLLLGASTKTTKKRYWTQTDMQKDVQTDKQTDGQRLVVLSVAKN